MKLTNVVIAMSQSDAESAINEWMPEGYALRHLHFTPSGACATIVTPWMKAEANVRVTNDADEDVIRMELHLAKWVPMPSALVGQILKRIMADEHPGVRVEGSVVFVDLRELVKPIMVAERIAWTLQDGLVQLTGAGVELQPPQPIDLSQSAESPLPAAMLTEIANG